MNLMKWNRGIKLKEKKEKQVEENIKKLEDEVIRKKEIPSEQINKMNKKVFENILIADIVMLFFYFISLGSLNIETNVFLTDLKVFSVGLVILSILLFEISYKKDSGNLCIHGIEVLVLAILTLFSTYIYATYLPKFHMIVAATSFIFAIYYVGKSIVLYQKMKKKYYTNLNDIQDIIKK